MSVCASALPTRGQTMGQVTGQSTWYLLQSVTGEGIFQHHHVYLS
jgi:hypothetical protein